MKLESTNTVVRGGLGGEKAFSFKLTAKAFEIVMAGIYQNKIGAVVREICSNADDSHRKAGKQHVPYTVKLPYSLEPYLIVDDEGTGLSPEDVIRFCSTVFESDKDLSNEDIGGFGLGVKSPYTITDSFNIATRWNGTEYNFITMKNEEGLPCIMQLGSNPTDRCNGMTITIPVKDQSYYRFRDELKTQLKFFVNKPTVYENGSAMLYPETYWYKLEPTMSYGNVDVYEKASRYNQLITVVMGGVGYKVGLELLNNNDLKKPIELIGIDFVINFPIGEVDIQPSREGLEYTDKTIDALTESLQFTIDEYEKETVKFVEECESKYLAWKHMRKVNNDYWESRGISYNNEPLYHKVSYRDHGLVLKKFTVPFPTTEVEIEKEVEGVVEKIIQTHHHYDVVSWTRKTRSSYKIDSLDVLRYDDIETIEDGKTAVFFVDGNKGLTTRMRTYMNDNYQFKSCLIVKISKHQLVNDFSEFISLIEDATQDDSFEFIYASTLPKPVSKSGSRQTGVLRGVKVYSKHGNYMRAVNTLDEVTGGVYILCTRNDIEDDRIFPMEYSESDIRQIIAKADVPLYYVSLTGRNYVKRLEANGVKHFMDFVDEKIDEIAVDATALDEIAQSAACTYIIKKAGKYSHYDMFNEPVAAIKDVDPKHKSLETLKLIQNAYEEHNYIKTEDISLGRLLFPYTALKQSKRGRTDVKRSIISAAIKKARDYKKTFDVYKNMSATTRMDKKIRKLFLGVLDSL